MSSNPPPSERSGNATRSGGNGVYDSAGTDAGEPFTVQLGDHLDQATRSTLQSVRAPSRSMFDFARRNPLPLLLAVGGLVWLFAMRRRSVR